MSHLNTYIKINKRTIGWVDAAKNNQLLNYPSLEKLGFNFKGTTDVLVATRTAILNSTPNVEMLLLLKLKKKSPGSALNQARLSLLLANLHSPKTKPAMVSLESGLSLIRSVTSHKLASIRAD